MNEWINELMNEWKKILANICDLANDNCLVFIWDSGFLSHLVVDMENSQREVPGEKL